MGVRGNTLRPAAAESSEYAAATSSGWGGSSGSGLVSKRRRPLLTSKRLRAGRCGGKGSPLLPDRLKTPTLGQTVMCAACPACNTAKFARLSRRPFRSSKRIRFRRAPPRACGLHCASSPLRLSISSFWLASVGDACQRWLLRRWLAHKAPRSRAAKTAAPTPPTMPTPNELEPDPVTPNAEADASSSGAGSGGGASEVVDG